LIEPGEPPTDVTIVVPAWGSYAGAPLRDALQSLRSQDSTAWILVVDNHSDEQLAELSGVQQVRAQSRLTVGAARNLGLERVETPFVLFWDADDLMLPGTLRFLREQIRPDPDLVAVAAGIVEGEPPRRHRWPPRWSARLAKRRRLFAAAHAVWSMFPSTGATIMRTEAVRSAGGYATEIEAAGDWVLGASLAFRGRVELHERPGRLYRRLGESLRDKHAQPLNKLRHAAAVRQRLREDREVPAWFRRALPLLAGCQFAILTIAAPVARAVRRLMLLRRDEQPR